MFCLTLSQMYISANSILCPRLSVTLLRITFNINNALTPFCGYQHLLPHIWFSIICTLLRYLLISDTPRIQFNCYYLQTTCYLCQQLVASAILDLKKNPHTIAWELEGSAYVAITAYRYQIGFGTMMNSPYWSLPRMQ